MSGELQTPSTWQRRDAQPYEPGNLAAAKHHATSPRAVQPIADALTVDLQRVAPWTSQPAFAATVQAWAWSEAQASLLRAYIDACGLLSDASETAIRLLDRVEPRAARLRAELGLTPNAWAKLVARLGSADAEAAAHGLERLKAVGRELDRTLRHQTGNGDTRSPTHSKGDGHD